MPRKLIAEIVDGDLVKLRDALETAAGEPPNTCTVIFHGRIPMEERVVRAGDLPEHSRRQTVNRVDQKTGAVRSVEVVIPDDEMITRKFPVVECPPGVCLTVKKPGARRATEA